MLSDGSSLIPSKKDVVFTVFIPWKVRRDIWGLITRHNARCWSVNSFLKFSVPEEMLDGSDYESAQLLDCHFLSAQLQRYYCENECDSGAEDPEKSSEQSGFTEWFNYNGAVMWWWRPSHTNSCDVTTQTVTVVVLMIVRAQSCTEIIFTTIKCLYCRSVGLGGTLEHQAVSSKVFLGNIYAFIISAFISRQLPEQCCLWVSLIVVSFLSKTHLSFLFKTYNWVTASTVI